MGEREFVIRAGKLIDGTGGDPLVNAVILVRGERIVQVGPADAVTVPAGAQIIDASDKTVLPGLIDAHVHVHYDGDPNPATMLNEVLGKSALKAYAHGMTTLRMGFTTIRSVASPGYVDVALRDAIADGYVQGPRIRACGQGLTATGGHMDRKFAPEISVAGMTGVADGPWALRKATREQIKRGADTIKINASVGSSYDLENNPSSQELTYEEMAAIIDQAHMFNRRVCAHTSGGQGITDALRAGLDSLEHAHWLTDEQIETMVAQGAFYVPTLIVNERCTEASREKSEMGKGRDWLEKVYVEKWETLRRAHAAGVKIAVGTDAGFMVYHGENACELEELVKGGFTPMEAIVAATQVGADCLDMLDDVGTVESGKYADLVIVAGDPLGDITILKDEKKIVQVYKGGEAVKGKG